MRENFDKNGLFLYGKFEYQKARKTAKECENFTIDTDDDECVDIYARSCYNCLFRRWIKEGFECIKLK